MKNRKLMLVCLSTLIIAMLLSACNSAKFDVQNTTNIEIKNGTTGEILAINEEAQIQAMVRMFSENEFEKKESSKNQTGWNYRITFYQDEKVLEEIAVMSNGRVSYGGNFYEKDGAVDLDYFDELFRG